MTFIAHNSLAANPLKRAMATQQRQIGLWVTFPFHPIVEVLGDSGFDWLLLDMEHSPTSLETLGPMLLALRGRKACPVVRVPGLDMLWIKRALDAGAPNIMVPNVQTAEQAREAVAYTRFAPQGLRGVAGSTRAANYSRYKDYMARANDEVGVIVQIESREAIEALDSICKVDGVDAIFVGPADLAAAMGLRGQSGHADVQAAIRWIYEVAKRNGKASGTLTHDNNAQPHLDLGASLMAVGTDVHLLVNHADALAARFAAPQA